MINTTFNDYDYYVFSQSENDYGEKTISTTKAGSVSIAIYLYTQNITSNIKYKDAQYIGLIESTNIKESCVIAYGDKKLKVLYVNPVGRWQQVYMQEM